MVYAKCTNVYSQSEMNVEDEWPADTGHPDAKTD